jgi:RNA polymerase sigma-70 factor (ECF subfamily)
VAGVDATEAYADLRPLLFSIAYRMLGSVAEAEDVVQEAFLRWHRAQSDREAIESPRAWLSAVTTRLAIDQLRSARVKRAAYPGPWLPSPLITDDAPDAAQIVEDADTLSMAFLLVLERLSPVERAVFLLHDVFDYGYDEIAAIVGKSEDNCRQLAVRARRHVRDNRPRFDASRKERDALARLFFAAVGRGDVDGLVSMLAEDVVVHGDGGGRGPSWTRPIEGRERVVRLLQGLGRAGAKLGLTLRSAEVNGQPGAMFLDSDERLVAVLTVDIADGQVRTVRSVINPDKLRHLGPLADLPALFRQTAT